MKLSAVTKSILLLIKLLNKDIRGIYVTINEIIK